MNKIKLVMVLMALVLMPAMAGVAFAQGGQPQGPPLNGTPPSGTPPAGMPPAGGPGGQRGQGQSVQGQPGQSQGDWSGVVKTVSSASLTVTRASGAVFSVTINSTTTVELVTSSSAGSVSDIAVGNNVTIDGRKTSDNAIVANRIMVEPSGSKVSGQVTAVSGTTITLASQKDKTTTVATASDTKFLKGKTAATISDVIKGATITAYGTKASDGLLSATTYVIIGSGAGGPTQGQGQGLGQAQSQAQGRGQPTPKQGAQPSAAGRVPSTQGQPPQSQGDAGRAAQGDWAGVVKSVSSSKLTVTRANSEVFTATVSSTTTVELLASASTGSVSDIATGNNVTVEGRPGAGNTIAATRLRVEPSGTRVSGQVSVVASNVITITNQKTNTAIVTSSATKVLKGKDTASLADVTKGVNLTAYGAKATDGSITATYLFIDGAAGDSGQLAMGAGDGTEPEPSEDDTSIAKQVEKVVGSSFLDKVVRFVAGLFGQ